MKQKIRNFLDDAFFFHLEDGADGLADSDSLMESGMVDSTGILELTAWLEGEFGVIVADEDMTPKNLDSIDKLVAFVEVRQ